MSRLDEVARDVAALRAELRAARQAEAEGAIFSARRRHIAHVAVQEQQLREHWKRLDPDASVIAWRPRAGEPTDVTPEAGVLQRLRSTDPVADSLGNADTYVGMANQVDDPAFENYYEHLVTLTTSEQIVGRFLYPASSGAAWRASKTVGTNAVCETRRLYERANISNPFNSNAVVLNIEAAGAADHEILLRMAAQVGAGELILPYLVGSIRVYLESVFFGNVDTNVTSRSMVLELFDVTDGVVRGTTTLDLQPLVEDANASASSGARITTAVLLAGQPWATHTFRLRIRLLMTTTGGTGTAAFLVGEPMAQLSYSPDVGFYQPAFGLWVPKLVANRGDEFTADLMVAQRSNEPEYRYRVDTSGFTRWGSGAVAQDTSLGRWQAGELRVAAANGVGNGALSVNDIVPHRAAAWAIVYNGDGTVASSTRSGDAGAATTTVTYAAGKVTSIVSVRAGHTVTVTPTYTGDQITSLTRAVV